MLFFKFTFFFFLHTCSYYNLWHLKCRRRRYAKGALRRRVYITAYSTLSLSLSHPFLVPRPLSILPLLLLSPSLSLQLPRYHSFSLFSSFALRPFIPLSHQFTLPSILRFFPSFRYGFSPPSSPPRGPSNLPQRKNKKKRKIVGLVVNYAVEGMRVGETTTLAGVATPPKTLMRQSIRDFRRRSTFFGVSRRSYQSSEIHLRRYLSSFKTE